MWIFQVGAATQSTRQRCPAFIRRTTAFAQGIDPPLGESSLADAPKLTTSSFGRVITLLRHSKLLDRTLLYTAVTRAEQQVILVSDVHAAKAAVEASRKDHDRPHFGCPSDPPGEPALNVGLQVINLRCLKTTLKSQAVKKFDKRHR